MQPPPTTKVYLVSERFVFPRETVTIATVLPPLPDRNMQPTAILNMARGKGKTIPIKLLSSAGTGYFYTTRRNVTQTPEKFKFVKFDPIVRRRVLFTEHKIK